MTLDVRIDCSLSCATDSRFFHFVVTSLCPERQCATQIHTFILHSHCVQSKTVSYEEVGVVIPFPSQWNFFIQSTSATRFYISLFVV